MVLSIFNEKVTLFDLKSCKKTNFKILRIRMQSSKMALTIFNEKNT